MAAKKKASRKPKKASKRVVKKRAPAKAFKAAPKLVIEAVEALPAEHPLPDHPAADRPLSPPPVKQVLTLDEVAFLKDESGRQFDQPADAGFWDRFLATRLGRWLFMVPAERA